jgi:N-acetylglucosaminyl-diphospho-decaprenol L-rhamnosyltransferase
MSENPATFYVANENWPDFRQKSHPARRSAPPSPLAVIIVTYNSAEVLPGLLDSLAAGLEGIEHYDVYVVDNASADDSVALAGAHPIRPAVIQTRRNGGYAAAINAATAQLLPDTDVLILNPDIRLLPGSVKPLVERLRSPNVGVAVPQIIEEDGRVSLSIRREPSISTAWADALFGGTVATRLGRGEIVGTSPIYYQGGSIEWATGAAIAVSARARQAIGDWDETFFLYSEEVDFQRRVRGAGLKVEFVAEARAIHHGGEYRQRPRLYEILTANRIRYFRRYHGPIASALFRLGVAAGEAIRSVRSNVHRAGLRAALSRWTQPAESLPPANPSLARPPRI